jgi:hypothetical protein
MAIRSVDRADGCTRIVVGDALTPGDVALVRDALGLDPRGRRVAIDLRGTRNCEAPALVMLARLLSESDARPGFLGLTVASERLLRYVGVRLGAASAGGEASGVGE